MRSLRLQDSVSSDAPTETGPLESVALSADGTVFACSRTSTGLRVTREGKVLGDLAVPPASRLVTFAALDDSRSISVICSTGEIAVAAWDGGGIETVGDIEGGIRAAAWSPDEVRRPTMRKC